MQNAKCKMQNAKCKMGQEPGRSKVVAAFGRKPLNFRIPSGLAATLEQPWRELGR
jgi:hypothetical protein